MTEPTLSERVSRAAATAVAWDSRAREMKEWSATQLTEAQSALRALTTELDALVEVVAVPASTPGDDRLDPDEERDALVAQRTAVIVEQWIEQLLQRRHNEEPR